MVKRRGEGGYDNDNDDDEPEPARDAKVTRHVKLKGRENSETEDRRQTKARRTNQSIVHITSPLAYRSIPYFHK